MKRNFILSISLLFATFFVVTSCKKDATVENGGKEVSTKADGEVYVVDEAKSVVEWTGYKIFQSENTSHFGTLNFSNGEVTVKDDQLESGKFTVDMNSLLVKDLTDPEKKSHLEKDLKSSKFFDIEKFSEATFEITSVKTNDAGDYNTTIDGNMTIKGKTNHISVNANVEVENDIVYIKSQRTEINRRDFDVNFTSPISNGVIKDEVSIQLNISAKKK